MTTPKRLIDSASRHPQLKRSPFRWLWGARLLWALMVIGAVAAVLLPNLAPGLAQSTPGEYEQEGGNDAYQGGYGGSSFGDAYGGDYGSGGMMGSGAMSGPGTESRNQLQARLEPILNRLRKAKEEKQKEAIRDELLKALDGYFEKDLKWRSSEIAAIQERVQRLQDRLDQRREAKDEILQLQLNVLENEAAGLGFFGQPVEHDPFGGPGGGDPFGGPGMGAGGGMGMGGGMDPAILGMGPAREPIPGAFRRPITIHVTEQPLSEVIEYLRAQDANIYLDQLALKSANVRLDTPLTMNLKDVQLATVLELAADSLSDAVGVRYEEGVAVLGTRSRPTLVSEFQWGSDGSQASQLTMGRLAGTGDYAFVETPLLDVVEFLQAVANVNVYMNERTLSSTGVSADKPVSIDLKDVKHRTALRLILDSLDKSLYFSVVDGVVVISTEKRAQEEIDPFPSGGYEEGLGGEEAGGTGMDQASTAEDVHSSISNDKAVTRGAADIGAGRNRLPESGAEQLLLLEVEVRSAKAKFDLVEASWRSGSTGAIEMQEARGSLDIAVQKLAKARREYAAQEKLLELDLAAAEARLHAAQQELISANQLADAAAISKSELVKFELAVQEMKLAVDRAKTFLELHREAPSEDEE